MFEAANLLLEKLRTDEFAGVITKYTAAGAIGNELISTIYSGGAIAMTMGNGVEGQLKLIYMVYDGGTATLTPSNFISNTIAFDDTADLWLGVFLYGEWKTIYATATVT